jgi:hypothetical protein
MRALLLLFLLTAGCASPPGGTLFPVSHPSTFPQGVPKGTLLPDYEPLTVCNGGNFLESPGPYTNMGWAFSWQHCVILTSTSKERHQTWASSARPNFRST